jgi:malonyl-CoA O-methyltransferase
MQGSIAQEGTRMQSEDEIVEPRWRRARARLGEAGAGDDEGPMLEIARRMLERLDLVRLPDGPIVDLGAGTGRATLLLRDRYPDRLVVAADPSPALLRSQRARLPLGRRMLSRLTGRGVPAVAAMPGRLPFVRGAVALLWSNLLLQWTTDPGGVFRDVLAALRPGGLFMFTTLGPDTLRELRMAFAAVDRHAHVHRFIDMHDLGDMLVHAGFADPVMDMETVTLTYGSVEDLVRDLRRFGSTNASPLRAAGLLGRGARDRLRTAYEAFRQEGRLPATFEIVYGHAWRPEHGSGKTGDGRDVIRIHRRAGKAP